MLVAIMLAVVVGMAALAVDGSRAYAARRDLQAAVDAAALAAGDNLQQTNTYVSAEQAASAMFGTNLRLYSAPSCSPGYGNPGASPLTLTCTYADGTMLTQVVSTLGPQGSQFVMTATRSLVLDFARILTSGTAPRVAATASSGVNNLLYAPTIAALNRAGCGGTSGAAITVTSGGTMNVVGDVVSNGVISASGSLQVAGDVYARCQPSVPNAVTTCFSSGSLTPCTYPDVAGVTRSGYTFTDPGYPPPSVAGGSQPSPGSSAVLSPGVYSVDPLLSAGRCYFLAGGVYQWLLGYTNYGSFVSNELKPPDEPKSNDNTVLVGHQLWNTDNVHCAGALKVSSLGRSSGAIREGIWSIVVTAVRMDTFNGLSYTRESAPSYCHTVSIGDSQVMQLQISNVPGATSFNVYAAPPNNGCSGPYGLAGSIPSVGSQQNDNTGGCAFISSTCSLGTETAVFDATLLGLLFAPNALAAPGVVGSYPPSSETVPLRSNLPNENANRAAPPAGDRANENQCDTLAGAPSTCPAAITPGAVVFYVPGGGCLNDTSAGDDYLFSGYQYNWMVLYEPGAANPPANTCTNILGAATDSAFIGLIYTPSAAIRVQKASSFKTDEGGGVIADTLTFGGQLPTIIGDTADYGPVPQASRLIA
ncbi:MAG: pilus assembly protein TadG-related protein [Candidatus Dormibacteraceae bacterium]